MENQIIKCSLTSGKSKKGYDYNAIKLVITCDDDITIQKMVFLDNLEAQLIKKAIRHGNSDN